jgi:hypothetical protein
MSQFLRKSIKELLEMSSAEVRDYLQTLSAVERKKVSAELYRVMLSADAQKIGSFNSHSQNNSLTVQ